MMSHQSGMTHQTWFLQSLKNNSHSVLKYEDKALQNKALNLIPISELEERVQKKMHNIRKSMVQNQIKEQEMDAKEFLLIELMDWFKNSFFSWMDAPHCNNCQKEMTFSGLGQNVEELREASRVEIYVCDKCNQKESFPRYQNPEKLLETRKGRCGEWANCFTLLCRSMGWDARRIIDETDHVWTEVYSLTQGRWLHCDPCENVCDQPLIYEKGWGKKLSYIMAYSYDDVQDVTWRYSCDHKAVLARRKLCSEEELLSAICKLRNERQKHFSAVRRAFLTQRLLKELVEFLLPKQPSEGDFQGRSSGSLAWRLARGETGPPQAIASYVWEPNSSEMSLCKMHILYSTAEDKYVRVTSDREEIKYWSSGVYHADAVFRKEEKDWKTTYLSRTEGSDEGIVIWKIDCTRSGLVLDTIKIKCSTTVFQTGKARVTLCNEETCMQIPSGDSPFETNDFEGSRTFTLHAHLSGGKGSVAWQHAQLFRQALDNKTDFPLDILVTFRKP